MNVRRILTAFAAVISIFMFGHSPAFAQLFAVLLGGNEVSAVDEANAGDPDGSGTATVVFGETTICYAIVVRGIDPATLAHIHEGAAGINGPIQVILSPPTPALETGATSSDCVPVDAVLLNNIRQNPTGFYVNVHNDAYPDGAVRGQLF
jgi:CHRD domain